MHQKWVSIIFFLSAVGGVSAYVPHQYIFVNESKTWTDAQSYCRQYYTHLATVNNMQEMKKLNATQKDKPSSSVWIGLMRGNTGRWLWSLADGDLYGEGGAYRNWSSGEPNNARGDEYCVVMKNDSGAWNDESCDKLYTFVCYQEKVKKYVFMNESKSWRDAQSYCREKYTDLASVRNLNENQLIWLSAVNSVNDSFWIGLFNDSWTWAGGSNSSLRYWAATQPTGAPQSHDCTTVSMTDQGRWQNMECNKHQPFICHENKLILIDQSLTWSEALRYCRGKHVDLVSVHSEEIQLWVEEVALKASTEHVWLGLRHTCTLGFWFWVSGESMCYQNWAPGNGTGGEDCISVERTGAVQSRGEQQWVSLPETQRLNFICIAYED